MLRAAAPVHARKAAGARRVGHLKRMKAEMARDHESFERKLRYLFWLN
jgi:hypothetical protein